MDIRIPEQNCVFISGRLTRDPELRFTQKGQGVCTFDVAVNRRYKDQATGEWKDDTTFVPVAVWGQMAERCKEKLKKGSPVLVEGRLTGSEYVDKAGQKRKIMRITARRVQSLAYGGAGEGGEGSQHEAAEEAQHHVQAEPKDDSSGIEEVPF